MSAFNDGSAATWSSVDDGWLERRVDAPGVLTWSSDITLRDVERLLATAAEGYDELRMRVDGRGFAVSYGGVHVSAATLPLAMRRLFEIHKERVRLHGGRHGR